MTKKRDGTKFLGELAKLLFDFTGIDIRPETVARRIVEVEEWSGSPSNYSSTDAYCASCLIDVNEAAGRTEKVQTHCKLPIRREDDSRDTYVKQAVFAAAGGRGIGRVTKPDDVSQDDWDSALEVAAMEIIEAYAQMGEFAPESIYEIAMMPYPAERAVRFNLANFTTMSPRERATAVGNIWSQIWPMLEEEAGEDEWGELDYSSMAFPLDLYFDSGKLFMVVSKDGMLYRRDVTIEDDNIVLGEPVRVFEQFIPTMEQMRSNVVVRQVGEKTLGFLIASTAVLNRVGQIDSTKLHDSFVTHATETGEYPNITVWHLGDNSEIGRAIYVAREDFCYFAVFEFNDDKFGRAAAKGMANDENGYWGCSIEFLPSEAEILRVGDIDIPVYTSGINTAITILPERTAASLFTSTRMERSNMNKKIKTDIARLFGDEDLAEEFAQMVDGTNRSITANGLIARNAQQDESTDSGDAETDVNTQAADVTTGDIELDDEVIRQIAATFADSEQVKALESRMAALETSLTSLMTNMNNQIAELTRRMSTATAVPATTPEPQPRQPQPRRAQYRPRTDAPVSDVTPPTPNGSAALSKMPQYKR